MPHETRDGVADVLQAAGALHYAQLHGHGRTTNGNVFSSIPPSDPAYVSGNLGGMVILHYVWPVLAIIFCGPAIVLGGAAAFGIWILIALIGHAFGSVGYAVGEGVGFLVASWFFLYVAMYRIMCGKCLKWMFKNLF